MREYERYTYVNSGNTWKYTRMNSIKVVAYKYTRKRTSMKGKRALTSLQRENSRGTQGVWKDGAPKGRLKIHATAALL